MLLNGWSGVEGVQPASRCGFGLGALSGPVCSGNTAERSTVRRRPPAVEHVDRAVDVIRRTGAASDRRFGQALQGKRPRCDLARRVPGASRRGGVVAAQAGVFTAAALAALPACAAACALPTGLAPIATPRSENACPHPAWSTPSTAAGTPADAWSHGAVARTGRRRQCWTSKTSRRRATCEP